MEALRQHGSAAVLGASRPDAVIELPANTFMHSTKSLGGAVEGDSLPDILVPQLLDLHMQGRFKRAGSESEAGQHLTGPVLSCHTRA
ncbi:hypothetical protein [Streptomyces clavifer]|uniref:hypothetical protein n=1 Tax=Streptomyces clavifer TaxID=68188 RepID=UPI0036A59977